MEVTIQRVVVTKAFETRDKALQTMAALVGDNYKINKVNGKWLATYEKEIHTVMNGECEEVLQECVDSLEEVTEPSPKVKE